MKSTLFGILLGLSLLFLSTASAVHAQIPPGTVPEAAGKLIIFGTGVIGDGLAPGWANDSLYNGPNTWNIGDTQAFYAGTRSLSWTASAPFERGWVAGPTAINTGLYQYLNFYARATEIGQRYEVGFVNRTGEMVGKWVMVDTGGGPIQSDRWQVYSWPLSTFDIATEVFGIGFRDANGAPQKKVYFDEIELSGTQATAPVLSPGLGQPGAPAEPPKPKGPYYPNISPWVFIIPGIIILIAIFFE